MSTTPNTERADVAYTDGEVLLDARGHSTEAILVRDGRVAVAGTNEEVLRAAGPDTPRQRLAGATVIPGLIDSHPHLLHFAAIAAPLVDITGARSHAEIVEAIRIRAKETPKGEWIVTTPVGEPHYFNRRSYRDLDEGCIPDRHVLDRATSDHPVYIQAWAPVVPNVIAMNSAALATVGIDDSTPDRVSDVWIEKDRNGSPTGVLRGNVINYYNRDPFFSGLREHMPPLIQPELVPAAMMAGMAGYNAMGITTIYEGHAMNFEMIDAYRGMAAQGLLSLRVHAVPELQPNALPSDLPMSLEETRATLERALAIRDVDDDWMRVNGVTACVYGPCYTGVARWDAGYKDPWGGTTTGVRGITKEQMQLAFDFCAEQGLRLNLCSIHSDEHDENIAMTSEVMRKYGIERTGWVIQHGEIMREDQAQQLADLGFDMTVSTSFTFGKGDMIADRFGSEVLPQLNPFRNLLDSGMSVAASMDWGPTNPFEQMQLAVTHRMFPSGRSNAGPAQAVSRAEAFEMWTAGGAKVLGWDGIGGLGTGNHADLAIVDRNPITCDLDALPSTRVLRTSVGGRIVHDSGTLPALS
ncbi:amidohydrolase [Streptomyces sp. NPDC055815]